jgi:DnaJ-domain-containing protein 1
LLFQKRIVNMVALLGMVGWAFIPHQATKQALKILHYVMYTYLHIPAPPAGTFEYQRHYRYTFAVVVLGYLIYTMIQGSNSMLPNYYEILGVSPTADENALKLAFRQFAKKYHPDRVGPQGQTLFIAVRDAFEALKNPTVRFAYDRSASAHNGRFSLTEIFADLVPTYWDGLIVQQQENTSAMVSHNRSVTTSLQA